VSEEALTLVGSDSRDLYKTNIFRALALPKGYIWQYRYRRSWIHGDIITNLKSLVGQQAVLFFATGNDQAVPEDQRILTYHPIRQVVVRDVVDDLLLGIVHFFLEMGDFANVTPHPNTPTTKLSPKCLVTRVTMQDIPALNWADRVKKLAVHFPNQLFFHVVSVKKGGKTIQPEYSEYDRSARYHLTEETGYQVEISFYDPKGGTTGLAVDNSNTEALLNVPSAHYLGTELDTTTFPLQTHTLERKQLLARTILKERERPIVVSASVTTPSVNLAAAATPAPPTFDVQLDWFVTRGWYKPWLFGFLAIMAAVGVVLGKLATDDLEKMKLVSGNAWLAGAAFICVGVPAGLLYWLFHKK
jgi:hypothetical protein